MPISPAACMSILIDIAIVVSLIQAALVETLLLAGGAAAAAARAVGVGTIGDDEGGHPPAIAARARWELML